MGQTVSGRWVILPTNIRSYLCGMLLVAALFFVSTGTARGQTLLWDPTGQQIDGSANWDSIDSFWYTGSGDSTWTNGDSAAFGYSSGSSGGSYAVSLTTNVAVSGISFNNDPGAFNFVGAGSQTLAIGSGGITVAAGGGAETFANSLGISLAASQSWANNSGNLLTVNSPIATAGNVLTVAGTGGGGTTIGGAITGSGGLTLSSGVLTLSAANNYTGATTISGGTLALAGGSLGNTAVAVGSGANSGTLLVDGNHTIGAGGAGGVTVGGTSGIGTLGFSTSESNPSTLAIDTNATTNLTLGGSTSGAAVLNFNYSASAADAITTNGQLSMNAAGAVINLSPLGGATLGGPYTLLSYASSSVPTAITLGSYSAPAGYVAYLTSSATSVMLSTAKGAAANAYWIGGHGSVSVWNSTPAGITNWLAASGGSTTGLPISTTNVFESATGAGNLIQTLGQSFTINSLNFTNSGVVSIGPTTGESNSNSITIMAGSSNGNAAGSGITESSSAGANTISAPIILGAAQSWNNAGSKLLTISGTVTNDGNLLTISDTGSGGTTLGGIFSGSGGVTMNGADTLTLSTANTYTGPTAINSGAVIVGVTTVAGISGSLGVNSALTVNSGGTLSLSSLATQVGSLAGSGGSVSLGTATLTVGADNTSPSAFAGVVSGGGGLTKIGSGTLTLSNANTYSGATTVNAGSLSLTAAGSTDSSGAALVFGGGTLQLADGRAGTLETFSATTLNAGASTISASGALGANLVLGTIARNAGATIDFTLPSSNSIQTSTSAMTTTSGGNGILVYGSSDVAYATVNGGSAFATVVSGAIAAATYSNSNAFSGATNASTSITTSYTATSAVETGVIGFTTNRNTTLTLTGSDDLVNSGAILVTAAALDTTIAGGTFHSGTANQIVLIDYGSLTVASGITDDTAATTLTISGPGITTLAAANIYTGANYLNGVVSISSDANLGAVGNGSAIDFNGGTLKATATFGLYNGAAGTNNRAIVLGNSGGLFDVTSGNTLSVAGVVSGTGSLTKIDSGTLALSASNTFAGTVSVNGGILSVGSSGVTSGSPSLEFGGGTLQFTLPIASAESFNGTTFNSGASAISAGIVLTNKLSLSSLTRNPGATVDFSLPDGGALTSSAVAGAAGVLVDSSGTAYATANSGSTWATVSAGSIAPLALASYSNTNSFAGNTASQTNITASYSATAAIESGVLTFSTNPNSTLTLSGANDVADSGGILVTSAATGSVIAGGSLHAGAAGALVLIDYGSLSVNSNIVNGSSATSLTISAPGVTSLAGTNTYSGTTYLNGIASIAGNANIGASAINFNGGTLQATGSFTLTNSGGIVLGSNGGTIDVTNGNTLTIGGSISGSGSLTLTAAGALSLGTLNTYTGGTTIASGMLLIGIGNSGTTSGALGPSSAAVMLGTSSGSNSASLLTSAAATFANPVTVAAGSSGTLRLGGNSASASTFSGLLTLDNSLQISQVAGGSLAITGPIGAGISGGQTLTFGGAGPIAVSGVISNSTGGATGTIAVVESGSGAATTLSGANTYSGGTTINSGALVVGASNSGTTNGALGPAAAGVVLGAPTGSNAASLLTGGAYTVSNPITFAAGSTGTLTLGGNTTSSSTFSGTMTLDNNATISQITGGTVAFNGPSITAGASTPVTLTFNNAGSVTTNDVIGGGAGMISVAQSGGGTTTLSGANTYTGATTVSNGTLQADIASVAGVNGAFGYNSAVTVNGGTLSLGSSTQYNTQIGSLAGSGGTVSLGSATLTLGGDNTNPAAFAGKITGSGGITKIGAGALSLAGDNTYSGGTTIAAGTLSIDVSNSGSTSGALGPSAAAVTLGPTAGAAAANLFIGGGFTLANSMTVAAGGTGLATLGGNSANAATFSGGTVTLDNSLAIQQTNSGGSLTIADPIVSGTAGSQTITFGGSGPITVSSAIGSGPGAIAVVQAGPNTLTLAAANTYSGGTTITSGTFVAGSAGALPNTTAVSISASGTLDVHQYANSIASLTMCGGALNLGLSNDAPALLTVNGSATLNGAISVAASGIQTQSVYQLATYTSESGAFTQGTVPTNYALVANANGTELDLQHLATIGTVLAAPASASIVTGGSTPVTVSVSNTAPSNSFALAFTATAGTSMIGSDTGTAPAGSSGSSTGSGLDFVGTTVGPGQTGNFTAIAANTTNSPQSGSVSVNVYDHATTSGFSGGTLNLGDVHFGYANPASSSNSLNVANGAASDYRVPLMATGGTSGNLTVSGFTGVGPGASGSISATLASGQAVGSLNTSVIEQFADNSSLSGASSNLGTATINVVGQVYSGQSTWTNARGGAWASDNNWADNNVTSVDAAPGLDPNLTTTDTATFGAGSIAGSVQVDLVNAAPSLNALSFAGNGTYTIVSSGAGSIALAGSVPTITAIGTQTINATLTLAANTWITVTNPSDWLTIGGNIGETGGSQSLTLSGLGTLVLSGTNTYTGGTTVDRGTLRVSSPGSLASGATVSSGATLSGSGTINGSVTVASGGIVAPSGGGVANAPAGGATLTVGALSLAAGSQLNYQASGPGVLDSIVVTSTASPASVLTLPASGSAEFNFFQAGSATPYVFSGGVYSLMTFGSAANDPTPGNISALSLNPADLPSGDLATFSTTSTAAGGVLELTIVLSGPLYGSAGWASSISGVYDSASNWNPAKIPSAAGVIATFPAVAGATSPIDVTVGDSDVAGQLTFNSSSTSYLLKCGTLTLDNNGGSNGIGGSGAIVNVSGGAAPKIDSTLSLADSSQTTTFNIDGTTNSALTIFGSINDSSGTPGQSIVLTGGGMLYLEGANGYSGGTTVNSGTLYAGDQSPLATLGGGSAPLAINGSLSIVNLSNTRFSIGNLCGSGAGQLNMNSATLTVSQSSSTTFAGTLSLAGASSNLTVIGNGNTLTLSGPVSIGSGSALTVNSGTLQIGGMLNWGGANAVAVNGGTLALNPSSPATVSGAVSVTVAAGATLRLAGAEALSQGSTAANITTAGLGNSGDAALSVVGATSQTVGVISSTPLTTSPTTYAGNTMVGDGMNAASLSAAQILQNTLAINAGSTVTILPYAGDQEGGQNSSIAATSATPAVASTSTEPFDTSDPFSAIQAAIASGAITSATGQSLENRITAIAQLSAADPGLDASQLESRVLAILPSNTAADALALETVSGLLASDTGPLGSSPASKIGSESAAFAPTATSAVNSAAVNPAAVPEPSTILLAAFGSVGLIFALRRRRDRRE